MKNALSEKENFYYFEYKLFLNSNLLFEIGKRKF